MKQRLWLNQAHPERGWRRKRENLKKHESHKKRYCIYVNDLYSSGSVTDITNVTTAATTSISANASIEWIPGMVTVGSAGGVNNTAISGVTPVLTLNVSLSGPGTNSKSGMVSGQPATTYQLTQQWGGPPNQIYGSFGTTLSW